MSKPRLLDLFCGAGGAAMGYSQAGFEVVGVDIVTQKHYPFEFIQADALEFLAAGGAKGFDAVHASPPCQGYSIMRNLPWLRDKVYPLLIDPTRDLLEATGLPWVIENVMGAHLPAGWLCGTMFGLHFYRHRAFESSFWWMQPGHSKHNFVIKPGPLFGKRGGRLLTTALEMRHSRQSNGAQGVGVVLGHAAGWKVAAEKEGIDWMNRDELSQAIPPVYTKFIGTALGKVLPVWVSR